MLYAVVCSDILGVSPCETMPCQPTDDAKMPCCMKTICQDAVPAHIRRASTIGGSEHDAPRGLKHYTQEDEMRLIYDASGCRAGTITMRQDIMTSHIPRLWMPYRSIHAARRNAELVQTLDA